ncbi:hypothetical protein KEM48_014331 [Puccinia striiformis f. sp. tritici PST-130]|nr:hypothetical protein KEM48_014331 [Puccinia striiformis f. sp. tritici PST-130]
MLLDYKNLNDPQLIDVLAGSSAFVLDVQPSSTIVNSQQQSSYQQEKSLSHFKNTIKSSLPKRTRLSAKVK